MTKLPALTVRPCTQWFLMRADPLLGQFGGDWALEIPSFLGPKWHSTIGLMPFHWAQKTIEFQGPIPFHLLSKWICTHRKQYARSCINHRCLNSYSFSKVSCKHVVLKLVFTFPNIFLYIKFTFWQVEKWDCNIILHTALSQSLKKRPRQNWNYFFGKISGKNSASASPGDGSSLLCWDHCHRLSKPIFLHR